MNNNIPENTIEKNRFKRVPGARVISAICASVVMACASPAKPIAPEDDDTLDAVTSIADAGNTNPLDPDNDDITDQDNCPLRSNSDQADGDEGIGDGVGNVCDNCPQDYNPAQEDQDNDGMGDSCDNCDDAPNSNQADCNGNGVGDDCDSEPCPTPDAGTVPDAAGTTPDAGTAAPTDASNSQPVCTPGTAVSCDGVQFGGQNVCDQTGHFTGCTETCGNGIDDNEDGRVDEGCRQ